MSLDIYKTFSRHNITITGSHVRQMEALVRSFEIRDTHVLALNTQLLGVYPAAFTDSDRRAIFEMFDLEEYDIVNDIKRIPFIRSDWHVVSDPFNMLAVWLIHRARVTLKDRKLAAAFCKAMATYLNYRFFTSLVNHRFPYGAHQGTMEATVNSLSGKFDILRYGTWRKLIEHRAKDLYLPTSIHDKTLNRGQDDKAMVYVITDTQTRIRGVIGNIVTEYYRVKDSGGQVKSRASSITVDGEKILIHGESSLPAIANNVFGEMYNTRTFIDSSGVRAIARQSKSVSESLLKRTLEIMCSMIDDQKRKKLLDAPIIPNRNGPDTVGIRALVVDIIEVSYQYCLRNKVEIKNHAALYIKMRDVFTASRTSDPDIIRVKERVQILIASMGLVQRDATESSLRIAVTMFIFYKSLGYL